MPAEADEADAEANEADKVILIGEAIVADEIVEKVSKIIVHLCC